MELTEVISILISPDVSQLKREYAEQELGKTWKWRNLAVQDQLAALDAAAHGPPVSDSDAEKLVEIVVCNPAVETVALVESNFFRYPKGAQRWALELLCRSNSEKGADSLISLLRECKHRSIDVIFPRRTEPRHLKVHLRELLEVAEGNRNWEDGVAMLVSDILLEDFPEGTNEQVSQFLNCSLKRRLDLHEELHQKLGGRLRRSHEIHLLQYSAHAFLVALRRLPSMISREIFASGMKSTDPTMRFDFLLAQIIAEIPIVPSDLETVASNSETRMNLYSELRNRGLLALMPPQYATNASLAESQMVVWLTLPDQLGQPPNEIELMGTISGDVIGKDVSLEYFVFRFRSDDANGLPKGEWMAGISGPYHRAGIERDDGSDTFSMLGAWGTKSPEEHLKLIVANL